MVPRSAGRVHSFAVPVAHSLDGLDEFPIVPEFLADLPDVNVDRPVDDNDVGSPDGIQQHFPGKYFDEGAHIAKKGKLNENLLKALKENDFFKSSFSNPYARSSNCPFKGMGTSIKVWKNIKRNGMYRNTCHDIQIRN